MNRRRLMASVHKRDPLALGDAQDFVEMVSDQREDV